MDPLIKKVRDTIDKHGMLERGDRVLAAVSGGPDSVFLLHSLAELRGSYRLSLCVAHLNHQLRGEESRADAQFVEELAGRMKIPAVVESFDLPSYIEERGFSVEEGARRVRYAFLERIADEVSAQVIALGHTANDQAETLLLRLIRGAGTLGLSSIPPKRGKLVRPLIEVAKDEILEWLSSRGVSYRIDSTNLALSCQRNVVRNRLIPELTLLNPQVVETLRRTAEILREEEEFLSCEVRRLLPGVLKRKDGAEVVLDLASFLDYNISMRRRIIREIVEELKGDLFGVSFKDVDSVLRLCESGRTGSRVSLRSVAAEKGYGELILRTDEVGQMREFRSKLKIPGVTSVDSKLQIRTSLIRGADLPERLDFENRAYFDVNLIRPPLVVRSRKKGDRFVPFGMKGGSKSLKDLFIEEKLPRRLRAGIPVLADEEGILWVVGHRRSDRAKVGPDTEQVLVVERL